MKKIKIGMLFCAVLAFVSCSDSNEIPTDNNVNPQPSESEEVAPNEYIVRVHAESEESDKSSREISGDNNLSFLNIYDANWVYMHTYTGDSKGVVQLKAENGFFKYRIKEDNGTIYVSGNTDVLIDPEGENTARFISGDVVYFSSWPDDIWKCDVADVNDGSIELPYVSNDLKIDGSKKKYPLMWMQYREDTFGSIEIFRSRGTFEVESMLPNSSGVGGLTYVPMLRVVGGFRETVIFTNLDNLNENAEYDYSIDDQGWIETTGLSHGNWSMKIYLGKFPTEYDLKNNQPSGEYGYYESNGKSQGDYLKFEPNRFKTGGAGPVGGIESDELTYYGYGISTDASYLCTPVGTEEQEKDNVLNSHLLVRCTDNSGKSKAMMITLPYHQDKVTPQQNQINYIISVFNAKDLKEQFGIDDAGYFIEPASGRSSRSTFMGYEIADIKPIKTYCISE